MYVKLFEKILDSSIWLEPEPTLRVFVTLLVTMDEDGFAQFACAENLANRARATLKRAQKAIACLESPDPNSSDPAHEGRRIERVPGGWMVLNAAKYRALATRATVQEQTRERVRRHRAATNAPVTRCNANVTPSEEETEVHVHTPARFGAHISHAFCWRVCVPKFLDAEFVARMGADEQGLAEQRVAEFYLSLSKNWPADERIAQAPIAFWRARFREALKAADRPKPGYRPAVFR